LGSRNPQRFSLGGIGGGARPPRDLVVLLVVLFVTYSLQFFASTAPLVALLRLTPAILQGFVWQIATYPFIGGGPVSVWFLVALLVVYWFGRDVFYGLGRKHFWRLFAWATIGGGLVAVVVYLLQALSGASPFIPFVLMQGQQVVAAVFIAAFATANRRAVIYLFFVLPIEARWFLGIEILLAFLGFLSTHDLPGFLGISAAVGLSYLYVRDGGLGRGLRQTRLRLERWWIEKKLERVRRRRKLRVVKGEGRGEDRGSWVN